jgi:hypothetical protein
MSPNKVKYFPGCVQVCRHHKIEWKEDWFECEYALNHITLQNWTSRHMSQTMENWWAILPSWVVPNPCFAKLPTPCHQGYSANFVNSTSYCGLPECSPNCPKWRSLQVAHCLGWFCTLLVIFGHNNNLQFSIIQKITKLLCSEASFIFLAWQASFMKIHGKFQKVIS